MPAAARGAHGRRRRGADRRPRRSRSSIIGIRPGEKMHEILVSEEEAPRTVARGDYLAIAPILPELRGAEPGGEPFADREYSSADDLLDPDAVAELLRRATADARRRPVARVKVAHRPRHPARDHPPEPGDRAARPRAASTSLVHTGPELRPGAQRRLLRRARRPRRPTTTSAIQRRRLRRARSARSSPASSAVFARGAARPRADPRRHQQRPRRASSPSGSGSRSSTWRPATAASTTACRRRSTAGSSTTPATC